MAEEFLHHQSVPLEESVDNIILLPVNRMYQHYLAAIKSSLIWQQFS